MTPLATNIVKREVIDNKSSVKPSIVTMAASRQHKGGHVRSELGMEMAGLEVGGGGGARDFVGGGCLFKEKNAIRVGGDRR